MGNIRIKKSTNSLNAFKQGSGTLREYTAKFTDALPEISNLDGRMAIIAFIMGLTLGSHLETSLSLQQVMTLPELLTREKQYIESEDLLIAKKNCMVDCASEPRHNRKQCFERRTYEEGQTSSKPRVHTWKPRHDNKVFCMTSEGNRGNSQSDRRDKRSQPRDDQRQRRSPSQGSHHGKCEQSPSNYIRGCIALNTSRDTLYAKLKGRIDFPSPKPLS